MPDILEKLKEILQSLSEALKEMFPDPSHVSDPTLPPVEQPKLTQDTSKPVTPTMSPLVHFCTALRDFEGAPGDLNYRNNNPGNFRCSKVGYAKIYGNVKCINNFAVFPTYEQGWLYLQNIVKERVAKHPTWSCLDFFNNYAPTGDNNNPGRYAAYVAARCAISIDYPLSKFIL